MSFWETEPVQGSSFGPSSLSTEHAQAISSGLISSRIPCGFAMAKPLCLVSKAEGPARPGQLCCVLQPSANGGSVRGGGTLGGLQLWEWWKVWLAGNYFEEEDASSDDGGVAHGGLERWSRLSLVLGGGLCGEVLPPLSLLVSASRWHITREKSLPAVSFFHHW